jgi:hypothetical protein
VSAPVEVRLDVLVIATATAVPTRLGAARELTVLPLGLEVRIGSEERPTPSRTTSGG